MSEYKQPAKAASNDGLAIVRGLNARQREAVLHLAGPCLVLAGAGSGKTRVITCKIAYLLEHCGYEARRVVALTFTNKAAREMSDRVRQQVSADRTRGLTISTFHSLGLRFLREEAAAVGLRPGFSILDAADGQGLIQELLTTTDRARVRAVAQLISLWKNALVEPDEAAATADNASEAEAVQIYRSYQATLHAYQAVDFDDLIRLPVQHLRADARLRARWQSRVHYLLVDEYQDTNASQYALVQLLCGERAMFTAVGDDDQAIYAWRGATVENLTHLARDYPQLQVIKLEQNYRSVQSILAVANRVIHHNPKVFEKTLWSDLGVGEPVRVSPMMSEQEEAESVAMRLSAARFERQANWRDFAVLYRGNHQARAIEQALRTLRIPYTVSGGQSFFDRPEIRDVLAWLRLIANQDDDPAFIRAATTPRRGIGQATLQLLGNAGRARGVSLYAVARDHLEETVTAPRQRHALVTLVHLVEVFRRRAQGIPPDDAVLQALPEGLKAWATGLARGRSRQPGQVLTDLLEAIAYRDYLEASLDDRRARARWNHVVQLLEWLGQKGDEDNLSLLELVQHVALVTMLDRADEGEATDTVTLSTLHAAKGLEFPHVYLIGVEEGLLPHRGGDEAWQDEDESALLARARRIEEERRLMYVGITRARRSLHLSWCRQRRRGREVVACEPSRFIAEMGLHKEKSPSSRDEGDPKRVLGRLKALLRR